MRHNGQLRASITGGLFNPVVWVARLDPLNLEMKSWQVATNYVWRVGASSELLSSSGLVAFSA